MKTVITLIAVAFTGLYGWTQTPPAPKAQVYEILVTEKGFQPNSITASTQSPVTLNVTRKTDQTCATQILVPSKNIKKDLPLNKLVAVDLGRLEKGEINFGCGMSMMEAGVINIK